MTSHDDVFVGRQPIYNRQLDVVAYELLFRGGDTNQAVITDGEKATSQLLVNTFMEIGLGRIVGRARAFLNVSRDFILGDYPLPPTETKVALEILEDVTVDEKLLNAVRDLSRRGYVIVLDDFVYHRSLQPLVDIADIIKIDVLALGNVATKQHVEFLRGYNVELLAEKVETQEDFEFCKELGFDYFQGFFFCKPKVIRGSRVPPTRLAVLRLLGKLQDPNTAFKELEEIIHQDASLSYKLLRLINSAFYALPKKVGSIHHALVILGCRMLRNWVSVIVMSKTGDKPQELLVTALLRARMCELLGGALRRKDTETFFTVGLFSVLDALLDRSMGEIVELLPLADEVNQALLHRNGLYGQVLFCVTAYERGDWEKTDFLGLPHEMVKNAYLAAVEWADGVGGTLKAA